MGMYCNIASSTVIILYQGFYYNKKMKVRSTSVSGSDSSSGSGSDSERAFSSSTRSGSEIEAGSNLAKFAGARFTSPPVPGN